MNESVKESEYGGKQIMYPYLPEGRVILSVPEADPFMTRAAYLRNNVSNEKMNPTGAVVVKDGKIIGEAANHAPLSSQRLIDFHKKYCLRRILHIGTGRAYWACPGCAKLKSHAEVSAVRDAHKNGEDTRGADLYLYGHWWCCKSCWDAMIKAGIRNVYLVEGSRQLFERKKQ